MASIESFSDQPQKFGLPQLSSARSSPLTIDRGRSSPVSNLSARYSPTLTAGLSAFPVEESNLMPNWEDKETVGQGGNVDVEEDINEEETELASMTTDKVSDVVMLGP